MRPASALLLALFAATLAGQAPIGFGPTVLNTFTWYGASPSGCSAGARGMCVGGQPFADTLYFTGWFANANMLPFTNGLPIVGTLNDFTSKTCSGNFAVIQLAAFSWVNRNAGKVQEVNCMSAFNSGIDAPAGWYGHCTSGDNSPGCVWHSRSSFVRGGVWYVPVMRQIPAGTASTRDVTLIKSTDGGATWRNPYTVAQGGPASPNGDPPLCNATASGAGNPCTHASYPGSIMWPAVSGNLVAWQAVQYGQDWGTGNPATTMPADVTDGCDPRTYTCFVGDPLDRSLMRVLNSDLPLLDVTKYQYYTCPSISDTYKCPGSDPASWSPNYADRTEIGPPVKLWIWSNPVTYIKEFKSYLMVAGVGDGMVFLTAPNIQGPWTFVKAHFNTGQGFGFTAPVLGVGYEVVTSSPPRIKLTMASDRTDLDSSHQGSLRFDQFDIVLGRTPTNGLNTNQFIVPGYGTLGAPLIYSDSHAPRTIPRKGLELGFDFYDHAGLSPSSGIVGMRDYAKDGIMMVPCHGPGLCDWHMGHGISSQSFGVQIVNTGYQASMTTMRHEFPQTSAIAAANTTTAGLTPANAPAAMQGNGTYTVVAVLSRTSGTDQQTPLWSTGVNSDSASSMIALSYPNATGVLELGWGLGNRWRYNSSWAMTNGLWYFIACTVQASGNTPLASMWVGENGALVDKIAGVSRTSSGGSPSPTPAVALSPLTLALYTNGRHVSASYGGLYVYSRVLGRAELGFVYQTLKAEMARRGVTLQ